MSAIGEPQGLDAFSESHSFFKQQEIQEVNVPTAAVESASFNIQPKQPVIVSQQTPVIVKKIDPVNVVKKFYDDNQVLVLAAITISIGYYYYKKNKK